MPREPVPNLRSVWQRRISRGRSGRAVTHQAMVDPCRRRRAVGAQIVLLNISDDEILGSYRITRKTPQ